MNSDIKGSTFEIISKNPKRSRLFENVRLVWFVTEAFDKIRRSRMKTPTFEVQSENPRRRIERQRCDEIKLIRNFYYRNKMDRIDFFYPLGSKKAYITPSDRLIFNDGTPITARNFLRSLEDLFQEVEKFNRVIGLREIIPGGEIIFSEFVTYCYIALLPQHEDLRPF